mmetsp:Transcript_13461/g.22163  ORF Transcript_13461/g.22163 Transcript_13461/m.22163 type:complete len:255 (-) Transcript_13461:399-1163(-)
MGCTQTMGCTQAKEDSTMRKGAQPKVLLTSRPQSSDAIVTKKASEQGSLSSNGNVAVSGRMFSSTSTVLGKASVQGSTSSNSVDVALGKRRSAQKSAVVGKHVWKIVDEKDAKKGNGDARTRRSSSNKPAGKNEWSEKAGISSRRSSDKSVGVDSKRSSSNTVSSSDMFRNFFGKGKMENLSACNHPVSNAAETSTTERIGDVEITIEQLVAMKVLSERVNGDGSRNEFNEVDREGSASEAVQAIPTPRYIVHV